MKGYDTLQDSPPTAPPPPYGQLHQPRPVDPFGRQQVGYIIQPATHIQMPSTHTSVQVGQRECCCCCCTCPFWVCCLIIGLLIFLVVGVPLIVVH